jgi:thiol-disulfide isomerase/thioredoxin
MKHLFFLAFSLGAVLLGIIPAAPRPFCAAVVATTAAQEQQRSSKADGQSAQSANAADQSTSPAVREADAAAIKELLKRDPKQPRPLLVNFWATWCEPCREEFPDLVRINSDYHARGLEFILVSLDDVTDIKAAVPQFLKEKHADMPAYLLNPSDPDALVAAVDPTWGGALPATFLFDAEGQVAFKHMGRVKVEELRAAIEKVISGK